jgi:two-component system sensor kinase ParS
MRAKFSFRSSLILKMVLLLALGFVLVSIILWLYFRNEVRDIGYYIRFGRMDEIALLVSDYVGDPPSRLRAWILAQTYDLTFVYRDSNRILWAVEKWRLAGKPPPTHHQMMTEMMGRNRPERGMGGPRRGPLVYTVNLSPGDPAGGPSGSRLEITFPPFISPHRRLAPLSFFLFIALLISAVLFLSLRKTFSPLDRLVEASERIGRGDLSYRIQYTRVDDFGMLAQAFNTMTSRLGAMISSQRDLLHFISHELRTPLTRILLALELKNRERAFQIIRDEVAQIDALVDEVAGLSRMDNLDREQSKEWVDLTDLISESARQAVNGEAVFRFSSEKKRVFCNRMLLEKAFANLLENARKYSDHREPVRIELTGGPDQFVIAVENAGPGIPEAEIEKIWEPFYRGANAARMNVEGRGLGLVVVRKAAELIGATVEVRSSARGPTVFTLRIPAPVGTNG